MEGIDDGTKTQLLVTITSLHIQSGQNLDKAKAAAGRLIDLAKANKEKDPSEAQWGKLIGAGYYLQGQAAEKGKDMGAAADAYIASYGILKDPKIMAQIKKLAKTLYDAKQFAEAEQVFRTLYNHSKDADSALILGQTLYRNNKADEALALFKEAYAKKQTGELAYNIGIILAKKSPQEAIDYLIVASLRYPAQAQNALGMAQNLYFTSSPDAKINDVINKIQEKQKKIDELTKSFNTKFADKNEEELTDDREGRDEEDPGRHRRPEGRDRQAPVLVERDDGQVDEAHGGSQEEGSGRSDRPGPRSRGSGESI